MMTARVYSTRRYAIVEAIVTLLKEINGSSQFATNLNQNVFNKLKFFQDMTDFPAVCVTAGTETRDYQAGGYRDRYLEVKIMVFINEDNPLEECEKVLEDIETLIEANGRLKYIDRNGNSNYTHDISILSIGTDEGALDPMSIGEITLQVHY